MIHKLKPEVKENIDFLIKILPLIAVLGVILGYQFISSYYDRYGIDIINYLDTTEILTNCFLSLFKFLTPPALIILIFIFFLQNFSTEIENWFRKKNKFLILVILLLAGTSILLIKQIIYVLFGDAGRDSFYIFFVGVAIYLLNRFVPFTKKFPKEHRLFIVMFLIMMFTIFTHFGGTFYQTKYLSVPDRFGRKRGETKVSFSYNDSIIASSDKLIFIGQTRNYLFLRDHANRINYIYAISDLKNLKIQTFRNKVNWRKVLLP